MGLCLEGFDVDFDAEIFIEDSIGRRVGSRGMREDSPDHGVSYVKSNKT